MKHISSASTTNKPFIFVFNIISTLFSRDKNANEKENSRPPQKKQKNVKFSQNVKIYFIPPIDDFKECLPNMYWNFDKKEDVFIPLKHMEFVYELNNLIEKTVDANTNEEPSASALPSALPPPPPPFVTTKFTVCLHPSNNHSLIDKNPKIPEWSNIKIITPTSANRQTHLHPSTPIPAPTRISSTPIPVHLRPSTPIPVHPNFIIDEKPNSLPYFFNEFDFNNEIYSSLKMTTASPPPFLYEIVLQNEIPQMFKGLLCYRAL